ncbi:MAG: hypothetical protein AVO33_08035 [delta proteobacterium ML8_F1]|nr:MAG: hypothetical protein AVO33_08035 [delta proteobacterium ML8_F1]
MKGDFHIHTSNSDCSMSPGEVFALARARGITHLSITDHDTVYGIKAHQKLAGTFDLHYIPGIEISAYDYDRQIPCHIVGLYVHDRDEALNAMIRKTTEQRHENSIRQIQRLIALGYDISFSDFENKRGIHGIYKQHIMDVLIEKGYATEFYGDFYQKMFKNKGPLDLAIEYPSHTEAVRVLKAMGAIPILAHPTLYGNLESVPELVEAGLLAVETCYPSLQEEDRPTVMELVQTYGLASSGGSDFHGAYAKESNAALGTCYIENFSLLK